MRTNVIETFISFVRVVILIFRFFLQEEYEYSRINFEILIIDIKMIYFNYTTIDQNIYLLLNHFSSDQKKMSFVR